MAAPQASHITRSHFFLPHLIILHTLRIKTNRGKPARQGREPSRNKIAHRRFCTFRTSSWHGCPRVLLFSLRARGKTGEGTACPWPENECGSPPQMQRARRRERAIYE